MNQLIISRVLVVLGLIVDLRSRWMTMNQLIISRVLVVLGLIVGLKSWWMTMQHVGDLQYVLTPEFTKGTTHAWYHAFRESMGDIAAMFVILTVFFGSRSFRTKATWWVCLIIMLGYYLPFWIGTPFLPELAAPHLKAEVIHILMALFPLSGLLLARKSFLNE